MSDSEKSSLIADSSISHPDYVKSQGKSLETDPNTTFMQFLFALAIATPMFLLVVLPVTLVTYPLKFLQKPNKAIPIEILAKPATVTAREDRPYDLVLFGATGFTGQLALLYLLNQYGNDKSFKWAIAGRSENSLQKVILKAQKESNCHAHVNMLLADTTNIETIRGLVNSTRVVISTVGPFDKYGTPLVQLCAQYGTHYCDITGETDWMRKMIDNFDDVARQSGARIVHQCGHDSVPWELLVFKIAEELKKSKEDLMKVECYDEIQGSMSGGTVATILHSLSDRQHVKTKLGFDPLLKSLDGTKSTSNLTAKNENFVRYKKNAICNTQDAWCIPFVMAAVMANAVRRSNAINKYSGDKTMTYYEARVVPSFAYAYNELLFMIYFAAGLFSPVLILLLEKVLPTPGSGPSVEDMDASFLRVSAKGTGSNGSKVNATIYFKTDPGYRDTARMLVESGLALALEADKINVPGGIYTPGCCQKEVLLERLVNTGTKFHIQRE